MIKAILFDLDGTLLDTGPGIFSCINYMIDELKLRMLDQEELESFIGPPLKSKLKSTFDLTDEDAEEKTSFFRTTYAGGYIFDANHYEGMFETLRALRSKGYILGVATYKREDMALELLKNKDLFDKFDVIHGSDKEGLLTKADIVSKCIAEMGVKPDEVIMIGDSENDAIGAMNAGAKFLGVLYGYGFKTKQDVDKFPNIGCVDDCRNIVDWVINS